MCPYQELASQQRFTFMISSLNYDIAQITTRLDYFLSSLVHTALPTGSLASLFQQKQHTLLSLCLLEFTKRTCLSLAFLNIPLHFPYVHDRIEFVGGIIFGLGSRHWVGSVGTIL